MKRNNLLIALACILLPACNSALPTTVPEPVTVQFTTATIPWLAGLYHCAGGDVVIAEQRGADFLDPQSADVVIRVGQPDSPTPYTYQIATDDLLVVVNSKNPTSKLTTDQVYGLFTGQIQNWKAINSTDAPVHIWVYPAAEDIQNIFNQGSLHGNLVSSTAYLANNPDEMLQAIEKDVNAIGIITQHWKTGNITGAYTAASNLPVLAITFSKPQGNLTHILACMQK